MPNQLIAERQFNLSFLNTAIDALALMVFGVGLGLGILPGAQNPALTLLPAGVAAVAVALAVVIAHRDRQPSTPQRAGHPKVSAAIETLTRAVRDTEQLLRGGRSKAVGGALAYLGFDVVVLWSAFIVLGTHPQPGLPVVLMAYIIGALGGSLPLPANAGSIGGMVGMFIVYGVPRSDALAGVLLYQAIGMLVPLVGGAIAYAILRHTLGGLPSRA